MCACIILYIYTKKDYTREESIKCGKRVDEKGERYIEKELDAHTREGNTNFISVGAVIV